MTRLLHSLALLLAAVLLVAAADRVARAGPLEDVDNPYHVIFATSVEVGVSVNDSIGQLNDIGGFTSADWLCTFRAYSAGLVPDWDGVTPVYRALLSTDDVDARDHVAIAGEVRNLHGDLLADDAADLWDGSLDNPVGYDEFATAITSDTEVWTGTGDNGTASSDTCDSWTNPAAAFGTFGSMDQTSKNWVADGDLGCNETARLYAVSPLYEVPEPASLALFTLSALLIIARRRRHE